MAVKAKKKIQYWGTGRRKKAIARVRLIPGGNGAIEINKRSLDEYFGLDTLKFIAVPLNRHRKSFVRNCLKTIFLRSFFVSTYKIQYKKVTKPQIL